MSKRGQSLELFYIDGVPDGMLTAEIFNWTGHVLCTPRISLAEALKRKEANFAGVYLLVGDSETSNLPRVYIGESDNVASRIRNHDAKKDWWTQAILITSSANSLNKAHVRYLESRLLEEAHSANRMVIENGTRPEKPLLSESATANMEQFFENILVVLPALRFDGFIIKTRASANRSAESNSSETAASFKLQLANGEVKATAKQLGNEFVVQAGSFGRSEWIGVQHNYEKLFDELVDSGLYVLEDGRRVFTKSYAFTSPSAAGAVLTGRATAGPKVWVLASNPNVTYKQWEEERLAEAV